MKQGIRVFVIPAKAVPNFQSLLVWDVPNQRISDVRSGIQPGPRLTPAEAENVFENIFLTAGAGRDMPRPADRRGDGRGIVLWLVFVAALALLRASAWAAGIEAPELSGADMAPGIAPDFGLSQESNLSQGVLGEAITPDLKRFNMSASVGDVSEEATSGEVMESLKPRILGTGQTTSGNEGFQYPWAVAVDAKGNVYVADTLNDRVQIFDARGNYQRTLGTGRETSGNEGFNHPGGIAIDGEGKIYVADMGNHRVQVFDARGNYHRTLGTGQQTSDNEGLRYPWGVTVDGEGNVYVADTHNHRIQVFDAQGNYLRTLGTGRKTSGNEGFIYPHSVVIDDAGNVYVADSENHRVQVFDAQGNYQRTLGTGKATSGNEGFKNPRDVAVDGQGNVYVSDANNHRVQIFDARGNYLRTLGTGQPTSSNKGFNYPHDIEVDGQGNVYVVDTSNHRVVIFPPITLNKARLQRELDKTVKSADWDGDGNVEGSRFKIWDLRVGRKP